MKKTGLYLLTLLALGFASCDDKSDLGTIQENPQEAVMSANGITLEYGAGLSGSSVDLNNYADKTVPVINLVKAEDLPEGATVSYDMYVASNDSYSDAQAITVTDGAVLTKDWENAHVALFGNAPEAKTTYVRFAAYVTAGSQKSRLGGTSTWYAAKSLSVTPINQKLDVEYTYYVGGTLGKVKMAHSDAHAWDDPNFSLTFDVTADQANAGFTWTVIGESGAVYGVSETGDPSDASGSLVLNGAEGELYSPGTYKLEVNMLDKTYKVGLAYEVLYTPGTANGWGFENNMLLMTEDYENYYGYVYTDGQFKFAANASWAVNWGTSSVEGGLALDGGNITVDEAGLYYCTVNLTNLTYTITKVSTIGAIGGFNGWGGDAFLTPSADYKTWKGDVTFSDAGQLEWKFRANSGWDINLGGSFDNLVANGANLVAPGVGTYSVTLNLGSLPYTCTMTAK
jgi:hypothetical protein